MFEGAVIDKSSSVPAYFQLKTLILHELDKNIYKPGDMIPKELELCEMFDLSRTTVRKAISELVRDGRLYRVKSKGTFVAKSYMAHSIGLNPPITKQTIAPGHDLKIDLMGVTFDDFNINYFSFFNFNNLNHDMKEAICISRRMLVDEKPIMWMKTYLPYDKCSFVLEHDFSDEHIHEVLGLCDDTRICKISQSIRARRANWQDMVALNLREDDVVIIVASVGYNSKNEPIDHSQSYYRADQNVIINEMSFDNNLCMNNPG